MWSESSDEDNRFRKGIARRRPVGGVSVIKGLAIISGIVDYLEGGQTLVEFLDDFPTVTRETAVSALERAKVLLVSQLG